jgi:hypothetical protein
MLEIEEREELQNGGINLNQRNPKSSNFISVYQLAAVSVVSFSPLFPLCSLN